MLAKPLRGVGVEKGVGVSVGRRVGVEEAVDSEVGVSWGSVLTESSTGVGVSRILV
jgi:hypothetical protein